MWQPCNYNEKIKRLIEETILLGQDKYPKLLMLLKSTQYEYEKSEFKRGKIEQKVVN